MNDTLHDFRSRVESFLIRTKMPASKLGRLACGDGSLVGDLRAERRDIRASTIGKVDQFMRGYEAAQNAAGAGRQSGSRTAQPSE